MPRLGVWGMELFECGENTYYHSTEDGELACVGYIQNSTSDMIGRNGHV